MVDIFVFSGEYDFFGNGGSKRGRVISIALCFLDDGDRAGCKGNLDLA